MLRSRPFYYLNLSGTGRRAQLFSAVAMLSCFSCSSDKAEDQDTPESQDSPTQKQEPTPEKNTTGAADTDSEPTGETTPESDATNTSSSMPDSGEKQRDCANISWGESLKEGAVVARGDVQGFVDSDNDGAVERETKDAGMCQFHLTGKKCGLVLYSRRT